MAFRGVEMGLRTEWEDYARRNQMFIETFDLLQPTMHKVFNRPVHLTSVADEVIFLLGRVALEDFMEVLLLCGNGYGIGATKILRGLYERTVTAGYLQAHPVEAQTFVDYGAIQAMRVYNHAKELEKYGIEFPKERVEQIRTDYEEVRERFREPLCKKCGTTKPQGSWSALDTLSMARKAGRDLEKLYFQGYALPTQQAHATVSSVLQRRGVQQDGKYVFDSGPQRTIADSILGTAHGVFVIMLSIQNDHFGLGLEDELLLRQLEFGRTWMR